MAGDGCGNGMAGGDTFSRADLIAELKRRFAAAEYEGIARLIEKILADGQMHEPEFVSCQDCGADIERSHNPARQQVRCDPCRRDLDNEVDERWKDGRFGS